MSFDIFVAGNNYSWKREGCEDGSTFDAINIITRLQGLDVKSLKHFGITSTGAVIGHKTPGITDLMFHLAEKEMLHNISNAVCMLAMNPNAGSGWIYVNATETNTLWSNTSRAAKYDFSPRNSPGAEFVTRIMPCLTETGLNNWGVLQYLSIVLTRFEQKIDDSMTPMINISLTN